jgi:propionyl-CoA carboxylase alpha chain
MNTRLQVEHPVTELITGVDLVEQMIRVADGEPLPFTQSDLKLNGWAIESRLYAEDPYRNFLPSIGRLTRYRPPARGGPLKPPATGSMTARRRQPVAVRNDTGVYEGGEISMFYDPMIAKLCTWAPTARRAIEAMRLALDQFEVEGIGHNLPFLSAVMDHPRFRVGRYLHRLHRRGISRGLYRRDPARGRELIRIAASAAAMHRVAEIRRTRITGRLDNHERHVGEHWVVKVAIRNSRCASPPTARARPSRSRAQLRVESDWLPGQSLARLTVDGTPLVMKVDRLPSGFGCGCGGGSENLCAPPARGGTGAADAGKTAARHLEIPALPDAGPDRQGQRGRRRRGAGGSGAGHRRGDEDGKHPARRERRPW